MATAHVDRLALLNRTHSLSLPLHVYVPTLQVDLMDFQSCPDGEFKFILNYQDHGTKFCDNAALTSKKAASVALALLDIFSVMAPPAILQCDNGSEFSKVASTRSELSGEDKKAQKVNKEAGIGSVKRVDMSDMVGITPALQIILFHS